MYFIRPLLGMVMLALVHQVLAQDQLVLASDIWPPFTDREGQRAFALELVEEALQRNSVDARTVIRSFDEVVSGIQNHTYQGSAAFWKDKARESFLLFSEPYLENKLILAGRKGADVSATSLADLTGKTVGVVGQYAYGHALDEVENLTLINGTSDQENLIKLLRKEVDYILIDALLAQYLIQYQAKEVSQYLSLGEIPLLVRPLHLAIHKEVPGASDIIVQFNQTIKEMITDGTYNRILQLNLIQADVDGDGSLELITSGKMPASANPANSYSLFSGEGTTSNQFVINGSKYQGWDNVPEEYKRPSMSNEDAQKFKIMSFDF
jgi:polar amino acid transport system substrate-binding protein